MSYVRRLAGGALAALLATTVLAACGSSASSDDDAKSGGPWSFTSGNGKTVKLDATPKRIIASGAEAAALLSFGIKPVGIYATGPVKDDKNLKDLDLSGITILGETWGEIDVEKAASLKPDLIVADWWPAEKAYSGLEEGAKASSKKLLDLAPIVGISQGDSIEELAQGYEELAASLGADVDDPEIAKSKKAFETAKSNFEKAVEAKPGLTALAVSPSDDLLYVANPKYAPELLDFQRWGLDVINPDKPDKGFPYWENLSWENADKYQPDLLLIDNRMYESTVKQGEKQPTWSNIKAAKAKAYVEWPAYWMHTYGEYATQLDALTAAIEKADPDLA
ncbi:ABC transporter substrate-binding protein [Aeromicrobium sp. NPDC092404]|uniref:ABC transporter substrate-binding protein n=1 Tax=Aeromicrobium sp. NPDC092404 TaxID=3154976 RepID=UPI003432043C